MPVNANKRLLSISADPAGPYLILESQSGLEISSEMESIEANVKTDTHTKSLPGLQSGSVSLEFNEEVENKPVQDDLYQAYLARNIVYVEETEWDGVGSPAESAVPIARSEGYITSYERSLGMNEVMSVSCEIELQEVWVPWTLRVSPVTATIASGATPETQQLTVTSNSTDVTASATYASSDTGVATVDASGLVTAVAPGVAYITATYDGQQVTATITVT